MRNNLKSKKSKFFSFGIIASFIFIVIVIIYTSNALATYSNYKTLSSSTPQKFTTSTILSIFKSYHYLDNTLLSEKNINDPITREQAIYLTFQALNPMVGKTPDNYGNDAFQKNYQNCYSDISGSYAEIDICWAKMKKLWTSNNNSFYPKTPINKGEAVTLLGKILKEKFYKNLIPASKVVLKLPHSNSFGSNNDLTDALKLLSYKNIIATDTITDFSPVKTITVGDFLEMLFKAKITYNYDVTDFSSVKLKQ